MPDLGLSAFSAETLAEIPTGQQISYVCAMPKRKEPELTPAEQVKRFKEAAKDAGLTKDEREFERAFKKITEATRRRTEKSR